MIFKDYYKILELKTNRVSVDEIKANYRILAKKYHPDVNITNQKAEERFKDINEAYRVLSNSASKRKYDRMWNTYIGNKRKKEFEESERNSDSLFSDFFNMFFGKINDDKVETQKKNKKPAIKGENVETEINIGIDDAYYGVNKKISLRAIDGSMKNFTVKIPAGIRNNEKIRLIGQGKEGKNGGRNGDLLIRIKIEDNNKFKLRGCDLYTDLLLTPWEAALGARVKVSSIDDEIVTLCVPAGMQSGEKVKIAKKGYKDGKGDRGDLIVEAKIVVPKLLTDEEKQSYINMAEVSQFNPRKELGEKKKFT